ncbi:hypothetical protein BKA69DRAFT_1040862 [Paraphysoderma sedebokerense]|nr:hypothetical protein BKA69DRAFT_1040862 [Paraphysoderma sedebokerense]
MEFQFQQDLSLFISQVHSGRILTSLHIYDFDSTLYRSPQPCRSLWDRKLCGSLISDLGWFCDHRTISLCTWKDRATGFVDTVLESVQTSINSPNKSTLTVLLTGRRRDIFHSHLISLFTKHDLKFDLVICKEPSPTAHSSSSKNRNHRKYETPKTLSTFDFKCLVINTLVSSFPTLQTVSIFEDRIKHCVGFIDLLSGLKNKRKLKEFKVIFVNDGDDWDYSGISSRRDVTSDNHHLEKDRDRQGNENEDNDDKSDSGVDWEDEYDFRRDGLDINVEKEIVFSLVESYNGQGPISSSESLSEIQNPGDIESSIDTTTTIQSYPENQGQQRRRVDIVSANTTDLQFSKSTVQFLSSIFHPETTKLYQQSNLKIPDNMSIIPSPFVNLLMQEHGTISLSDLRETITPPSSTNLSSSVQVTPVQTHSPQSLQILQTVVSPTIQSGDFIILEAKSINVNHIGIKLTAQIIGWAPQHNIYTINIIQPLQNEIVSILNRNTTTPEPHLLDELNHLIQTTMKDLSSNSESFYPISASESSTPSTTVTATSIPRSPIDLTISIPLFHNAISVRPFSHYNRFPVNVYQVPPIPFVAKITDRELATIYEPPLPPKPKLINIGSIILNYFPNLIGRGKEIGQMVRKVKLWMEEQGLSLEDDPERRVIVEECVKGLDQ